MQRDTIPAPYNHDTIPAPAQDSVALGGSLTQLILEWKESGSSNWHDYCLFATGYTPAQHNAFRMNNLRTLAFDAIEGRVQG